MRRIFLTGRNGQVGWELERALPALGQVTAVDVDDFDLADPEAIRSAVRQARPEIVVNAAAYTAVDRAESEPDLAMAINGEAPGILAEEAHRLGALLVHYSTDYVFDGTSERSYREDDPPAPANVYGRTKLAGERAVVRSGCPHLIFRTSWVYGARGSNFLLTMLRLAGEREELRVVDDKNGAPTWCRSLSATTLAVLRHCLEPGTSPGESLGDRSGIYHATNAGCTTWFGFTGAILSAAFASRLLDPAGRLPRLIPVASGAYPTAAARPANSVLSCAKLEREFGVSLPGWRAALDSCLAEMS